MKTYCQCNFSEIFKGRQIILEPCRNSKYPIRCLLWCHKTLPGAIWTQSYLEPLKHLRWSVFAQIKNFILDVWRGSDYAAAAKQGKCKVSKINTRRRYVKDRSRWCVFWNISMILPSVWLRNVRFRSSHLRYSIRKGVLRNFARFTGKYLCQGLFFNKVARLRSATLFKK